jgi:hypothetical protein
VKKLIEIRDQSAESPTSDNRVNAVFDDVFQLLSLFFMAVGKNKESPATYAQLATLKVKFYLMLSDLKRNVIKKLIFHSNA